MQLPCCVVAFFIDPVAAPGDDYADLGRRGIDEIAHAVLHAGGDDEVFGLALLQHQPLHLDVIAGMAPVALGVQVAEVQAILQAELDAGQGAGDLARDEGFAADRATRG
jgi:hypothetical protein